MVASKLTSIIIAILIKILIVLTIIDHGSSESEVEKCTRYIEQLYDETDPSEMFKKGFLYFNLHEIKHRNKRFVTDRHTPESKKLLKSMNKYTEDYFIKALFPVRIHGKESLPTPEAYCQDTHEGEKETIKTCTNIIREKLNLTDPDIESGSDVFNFLYHHWSKEYVQVTTVFYAEYEQLKARYEMVEINPVRAMTMLNQLNYYEVLFGYIQSYYQIFENILENADVSDMPSPERYCQEEIEELAAIMQNINIQSD